jgi:hypothetical protein
MSSRQLVLTNHRRLVILPNCKARARELPRFLQRLVYGIMQVPFQCVSTHLSVLIFLQRTTAALPTMLILNGVYFKVAHARTADTSQDSTSRKQQRFE